MLLGDWLKLAAFLMVISAITGSFMNIGTLHGIVVALLVFVCTFSVSVVMINSNQGGLTPWMLAAANIAIAVIIKTILATGIGKPFVLPVEALLIFVYAIMGICFLIVYKDDGSFLRRKILKD